MKTLLSFILLSAFCVQAQDVSREQKIHLVSMVAHMPVSKLRAIDANCPTKKHDANIYFWKQINAATNNASFLSLSNKIAAHQ